MRRRRRQVLQPSESLSLKNISAEFSDFDNIEPASEVIVPVTQSGTFACNLPRACTHGELAVHLSATVSEKNRSSMCINGLQVLNERRVVRGFNLAVIDGENFATVFF